MQRWQCRYAPSLGALEDTPDNIWKTKPYIDEFQDTIFMGLYGLNDFFALWKHKGRKAILWCGSDIQHFLLGYWLDNEGKIRIHPSQLAPWIDTNCENYVENEVEQQALRSVGIRSKVVPSFLGKTDGYEITYKWSDNPKVYTSVSGDNYELYGWDKIANLAKANPHIEFHLYGSHTPFPCPHENMIDHGRVPKEQMNEEIKDMQGCLRLTTFDGFSEIVAKSYLLGQWPVSLIHYPHSLSPDKIEFPKEPNINGRKWFFENVNKYPWNQNV